MRAAHLKWRERRGRAAAPLSRSWRAERSPGRRGTSSLPPSTEEASHHCRPSFQHNHSTIAGLGDWRDMELMVAGGLTPLEAIKVATFNGAVALDRQASIGSIAVGKNADLILVDGNPAANIADIENTEIVFKDGIGYDTAKIFASVKGTVGRQ